MRFEFVTATRIVFGPGSLGEIGGLVREYGRRPLVVTGRNPLRAEGLSARLAREQLATTPFSVGGEPDINSIKKGVAVARQAGCDFVIGLGGGSALDAGKAIAALMANDGDLIDYLEVVGQGRMLERPSFPYVAIPTTAGTGSEVTRNAVIASPEHRVKVSLRSPFMFPRLALVDSELTIDLPPALTASTGIDALTQLIEAYVSCRANPVTDALCVEGIRRAAGALRLVFHDGQNREAREDMALASLLGGLALANAGLGAVHGFAGPIGGMFEAPHGAVCAALLPHVLAGNLRALRGRAGQPVLRRLDDVARLLTGKPAAVADDAVEWLRGLVEELQIPRLGAYGVTVEHVGQLVEKAARASSMKANPLELTTTELAEVLAAAL